MFSFLAKHSTGLDPEEHFPFLSYAKLLFNCRIGCLSKLRGQVKRPFHRLASFLIDYPRPTTTKRPLYCHNVTVCSDYRIAHVNTTNSCNRPQTGPYLYMRGRLAKYNAKKFIQN
ncbi:hypothetical protein T4B_958 [Trichinella pseudospiralis]|uniref:Uncharacterized protein n=2 Tax=Trichinella pseudospiralis TaxID=6337 RepID=A0A0V1FHF3_TRIPS|nr:hypothetical protein T4E_7386 [Trichinella pseudospiralis]KRY69791.1 hypothetical protein T4A_13860 [Trichinella pseudospiralis]KRY85444.1 hypothetical protein T4D_429 [Trichinella pseudospiralis]KRZ29613.1 hypothetical protein T4B_958 [Trichinella pseudospiralis]KRZ36792.1 hypothetical protein T4C_6563 [Trichinella pseudospiralis]